MTQLVYNDEGKVGILTGADEEGAELVVWLGKPVAVKSDVDEKGNGTPGYSTSPPTK